MKRFLLCCVQIIFTSTVVVAQQKSNDAILKNISGHLPSNYKTLVVSKDANGDFNSIQDAINAVPDYSNTATVIIIKNGVYKEKLHLDSSKINVYLVGEDVEKTVITYDDYAAKKDANGNNIGTSGSAGFFVYGDNFHAENITFHNTAGPVGQAVAVRITADKASFINCRFLGFQDTLYTHGATRQYYLKCYIEGTVDFIFGAATAVFDRCIIFGKKGGFYTAASTPEGKNFGYVFLNCKITGNAPPGTFYLGRPWRPFAKTVFINCEMDDIVKPEGWSNWNNPGNEKTVFYAEYNSYGAGANPSSRVAWSRQLRVDEAKMYTLEKIFDNWNPLK